MPQNLKTKPDEGINDDLPILSEEEEAFVALVADGRGYAEAYRIAYNATGYNANSLAVKASRKVNSPKIHKHLQAIQAAGLAKIGLSREERIKARLAFAARAERAGNYGAANGANDAIDKMLGHMVERFEDVTQRDNDPFEALRQIEREFGAEQAKQAAHRLNIPWPIPRNASQPAEATTH